MVPRPVSNEISRLLAEGKGHREIYERMIVKYAKLPEELAEAIAARTLPAVKLRLCWVRLPILFLLLGSCGLKVYFMKILPSDAGVESLALPFLALVDAVAFFGLLFWRPVYGYYAIVTAGFGIAVGIWMDLVDFEPIPLVAWIMLQMVILTLGIPLGRKVGGRYTTSYEVMTDVQGRATRKPTVEWQD